MGKVAKALRVILACSECKSRNYRTRRRRPDGGSRLELKKFCRQCREHRLHIESR